YLISEVGVTNSFRYAAATNIAIGIVAVVMSHVWRDRPATGNWQPATGSQQPATVLQPESRIEGSALEHRPTAQHRAVLWTFFLSGVMSLALEIIWFRMLVVFLRPTAY